MEQKELIFENDKYRVYKYNHWWYKDTIKFDVHRKFIFFWIDLITFPTEEDWRHYVNTGRIIKENKKKYKFSK
jgi:hypothetical protein